MRASQRLLPALAAVLLLTSGCGSSTTSGVPRPVSDAAVPQTSSTARAVPPTAPSPTTTTGSADSARRPDKVMVVVEENHAQDDALSQMPYLASLADKFGQTTDYKAVAHPSLPNYLAIAGGSTFGVTDDLEPSAHQIAGPSVFDLAIAAGATAKTYAEEMNGSCELGAHDVYAVKHNPWTYFSDSESRKNCQKFDVPSGLTIRGALRDDIDAAALPTVGLLIPDRCNDAHDCPLSAGDAWLGQWVPELMKGPDYQAGRLAIVVTFDEDDSRGDNVILTVVIAPHVSQVVSSDSFTHYSLTRYLADLSGATPPGESATAPSLRDAFGI